MDAPESRAVPTDQPQFSLGCLLLVVLLIALPLGAITALRRISLGGEEPRALLSQEEWPRTLREFAQEADEQNIAVLDSKMYLLSRFFGDEALWQVKATSELLEAMIAKWELTPIAASQVPSFQEDLDRAPEGWYAAAANEQPVFYAKVMRKNDNFIVMHAPQQRVLIVWYYFNF